MHTAIVVDEAHRDVAAEAIAEVLRKRGTAEIVTLAEYLGSIGIVYDEETGYLVSREPASNGARYAVCNRVVQVSEQTASSIDGRRDVLTPNLVLAEYARVLGTLPKVWGSLGSRLPSQLVPLNLQWRMLAGQMQDVKTPCFRYGFGAEDVEAGDFCTPLWKSPFDLYGWQATSDNARPDLHAFVVDKPQGEPVVAYFVGNADDAFPLRSDDVLDEEVRERLKTATTAIKDAFETFMGEALFFVDGKQIVFAAYSPYLKTSATRPDFTAVLERGFI